LITSEESNSQNGTPAVSVVIPTYNRAHLVGRAITSALTQIRAGDEVIVVDDGSTDSTIEALRPFRERVRYIKKKNGGAGAARNTGVQHARNPLVAFLDSDDEWMPGKIAVQRGLMQARPDLLFCFSDFAITDKNGQPVHRYLTHWLRGEVEYWRGDERSWNEILGNGCPYSSLAPLFSGIEDFPVFLGNLYPTCLRAPYSFTGTVMVRRVEAGDSLYFDEDVSIWEEWLCFARLARKGTAAFLDTETAWQHDHAGPRLMHVNELVCAATRIEMLQRIWGQDAAFLVKHGDLYRTLLSDAYLRRATILIKLGRTAEARAELKRAASAPMLARSKLALISLVPDPYTRALIAFRRAIKRKQL
jgi:glycosyltransferase involved in cell wall biosynthesis